MGAENDNSKKIFSPREVADIVFGGKVSYSFVLYMAQTGKIPFHRVGKRYFIWHNELEKWIDANGKDTEKWRQEI
ncbi:helix-turn-helix domain-containing protein [uncultured Dialister sp.]|uniref:helix-turn-helix domain-containing protein n=1 Tax=uncultured Dialister sp. TaxID=278064 RepID=UPI0025DC97CE|nr:helix-turn-helix domain-containing protein [uncultured Dialister sp.]